MGSPPAVLGNPGKPAACVGTSSSFGLPLSMPTIKMLVTLFALSVAEMGIEVWVLLASKVNVYEPTASV